MRYPAECPVFEFVGSSTVWVGFDVGVHVQIERLAGDLPYTVMARGCDKFSEMDYPQSVPTSSLRPLTRAARDMLALVTP